MKFLVFDTETTGLPKDRNATPIQYWLYPYIVQFSWLVFDDKEMRITNINNHVVKLPDGVTIPEEASKIHGITNEIMMESGEDIRIVLDSFNEAVKNSQIIVAHNIKFDDKVVQAECIRNKLTNIMTAYPQKIKYCTMDYGKTITRIEKVSKFDSRKKYLKPPKLFELHQKMFKTVPNNLHNSLVDVFVCFRCFFAMINNYDLFDPNIQKDLSQYYNELTQISN